MRIFLLIILFVFTKIGFSQQNDLQFERIADPSGRSLGHISSIVQDDYGFIWLSTRTGLLRYDGYDYKRFQNRIGDSTSIPFNNISKLFYDKSGVLWLRCHERLFTFFDEKILYNPDYQPIVRREHDMAVKLIEDNEGNYWIGQSQSKLLKFNKSKNKITQYTSPPEAYLPEIFQRLKLKNKKTKPYCKLVEIGNEQDTSKTFSLSKKTDFLIISVGESDKNSNYDYAYISGKGKTIWNTKIEKLRYAGGAENNKIVIDVISLNKGTYEINYISDSSNSWENRESAKPTKIDFYGIKIFEISEEEKEEFQKLIQKKYIPNNSFSASTIFNFLINKRGQFTFVSEQGIEIYNSQINVFQEVKVNFRKVLGVSSDDDFAISSFIQDRKGYYWVGSSHGIVKFKSNVGKIHVYHNTGNANYLADNYIQSLFEDSTGQIWIGTQDGFSIYTEQNGFRTYRANNHNQLYDDKIFQIFEDRSQNIWISCSSGLNKLKKNRFNFFDLGIERYVGYNFLLDSKNTIWYGGEKNSLKAFSKKTEGILEYKINEKFFPYDFFGNRDERRFSINDIFEDNEKKLWLAIGNKLLLLNKKSKKVELKAKLENFVYDSLDTENQILKIVEADKNSLWIFTISGIFNFDKQSKMFVQFIPIELPADIENISTASFYKSYYTDSQQNTWIRTDVGLYKFSPHKAKLELYLQFHEELQFTSLTAGNIFETADSSIWLACMPYIYKVSDKQKKPQIFILEENSDIAHSNILVDTAGIAWIYGDNGLYEFNTKDSTLRQYSTYDGLIDKNISSIIDDGLGNLWITTLKGLNKFDKQQKSITTLFHSTDIRSFKFIGSAVNQIDSKKEFLFFTTRGFVNYFPNKRNKHIPPVVITRLSIAGEDIDLDSLIYKKHFLELDYDENFLDFEFSALDFTEPDKNKYVFIMKNLKKADWKFRNAINRTASYTSLPAGDYTFVVRGSNNDKVWNDEGAYLHIKINPPIWLTSWFLTLSAIFIVLTFYLFIKWREKKLIQEKEVLEQKVKERTAKIQEQHDEIEKQRDLAENQRDMIAEQKKGITDSIRYASRIQLAVLPPKERIAKIIPKHFILNKPRDIVSGDYYWLAQKGDKTLITAADCTGHGVPGAFMSMLGLTFLNQIANMYGTKNTFKLNAGELLDTLKKLVINSLHQTGVSDETKDGMDMALCIIDKKTLNLEFAGAYNPLYLIRNKQVKNKLPDKNLEVSMETATHNLFQIRADRMPIGIHFREKPFTNHTIKLEKDDTIYLFSDGYVDQFGGEKERKFMAKRFKELLLSIQFETMEKQKEILDNRLKEWRGNLGQVDDVLVLGIEI